MAETNRVGDTVDFGVITIREDEYSAVYERLGDTTPFSGLNRTYVTADVANRSGETYRVALLRCIEQGPTAAQNAARDLIDDLDPRWLAVVGIAGAFPDGEFTLGDVVVASRLHDFTVGAYLEDALEFVDQGGPMATRAQDLAAVLPGLQNQMQGWQAPAAIQAKRPAVDLSPRKFYGSATWKRDTARALAPYFAEPRVRDDPIVTVRAVAANGMLVKNAAVASQWLKASREIREVEMELSGVYTAARRMDREYPVLAIRGISDIVGFKRDPAWTSYACNTAASFFVAMLRNLPRKVLRLSRTTQNATPDSGEDDARFIGRVETLFGIEPLCADILKLLRTPGCMHVGLHGIGGVGKSSLADAVATRARDEGIVVDVVFRRSSRDGASGGGLTYAHCFDALVQRLRLGPGASAESVSDGLRQRPFLIYLDNLETCAEPQDDFVTRLCNLVEGTAARVLLTSRQAYADPRISPKRLTGIDKDACGKLIRHLGGQIPGVDAIGGEELDAIFEATGGVPLAIRLVVPQFGTENLDRVLARLKLVTPGALEGSEDDEYHRFYRGIIDWSWNALWRIGETDGRALDAGRILVFLANLPATPSGAADVPTLCELTKLDDARVGRAIDLLYRFSLVEVAVPPELRTERRFFAHPLVQQYVEAELLEFPRR